MTDLTIDLTEDLSYELGLGWRNVDGRPSPDGRVLPWLTKNGIPVMVPDQWAGKMDGIEPLPQGTPHVKIGLPNRLPGASNL